MIDLHSHVLPGIDDGPATMEGSLQMARVAAAAGTQIMLATPHVPWQHRNDAATIAALVAQVNASLLEAGIVLEVRAGAEVAMTRIAELDREELGRLTLGGGEWLLLEPPFTPVATGLELIVADVRRRGFQVLLAHPERCPAFHREPDKLSALTESGVLLSITAGSLVGRFGGPVQRFALELARAGLVHNVASDSHDAINRAPGTRAELVAAGLEPLAEWLTEAVPAAILDGGEIPRRPYVDLVAPGRRWTPPWRRRDA